VILALFARVGLVDATTLLLDAYALGHYR